MRLLPSSSPSRVSWLALASSCDVPTPPLSPKLLPRRSSSASCCAASASRFRLFFLILPGISFVMPPEPELSTSSCSPLPRVLILSIVASREALMPRLPLAVLSASLIDKDEPLSLLPRRALEKTALSLLVLVEGAGECSAAAVSMLVLWAWLFEQCGRDCVD